MSECFASIKCPKCGFVSYNRNDISQKYCGNCKNKFPYGDEQKAIKEYENNFPETQHLNDVAVVCDNCYELICAWVNSLSKEERMNIVKEAERKLA